MVKIIKTVIEILGSVFVLLILSQVSIQIASTLKLPSTDLVNLLVFLLILGVGVTLLKKVFD